MRSGQTLALEFRLTNPGTEVVRFDRAHGGFGAASTSLQFVQVLRRVGVDGLITPLLCASEAL